MRFILLPPWGVDVPTGVHGTIGTQEPKADRGLKSNIELLTAFQPSEKETSSLAPRGP